MSVRPLLLGAIAAIALLVTACTNSSPGPATTAGPTGHVETSWQQVALPDGHTAVSLATDGVTMLVGTHSPDRPSARLLSGTGTGNWREVPITPRSPYAFEGRWFQVATHDGRIDAIAGARGGAHGNYRWTTWSGTNSAVAEQEQPFGVFGSYGAGDLAGLAYAGGSPVILGAWQSDRTGMDVATWTRTGARWARLPSTGTPLGSTPEELVSGSAITSHGDGLMMSGSVTRLAPGSVKVEPSVWTSPDGDGPWTRVDLGYQYSGDAPSHIEAHAATCSPQTCVVSGTTGRKFTMWEVGKDTTSLPPGIPDVEVTENASVLAPLTLDGADVFVAPTEGGSTVLRRSGDAWSVGEGPSGTPVSAIVDGDELWVVTVDAQATGTLWRSRVA